MFIFLAANEELKTLQFIEKLEALLKQIKELESTQNISQLQCIHELSTDQVESLLKSQEVRFLLT